MALLQLFDNLITKEKSDKLLIYQEISTLLSTSNPHGINIILDIISGTISPTAFNYFITYGRGIYDDTLHSISSSVEQETPYTLSQYYHLNLLNPYFLIDGIARFIMGAFSILTLYDVVGKSKSQFDKAQTPGQHKQHIYIEALKVLGFLCKCPAAIDILTGLPIFTGDSIVSKHLPNSLDTTSSISNEVNGFDSTGTQSDLGWELQHRTFLGVLLGLGIDTISERNTWHQDHAIYENYVNRSYMHMFTSDDYESSYDSLNSHSKAYKALLHSYFVSINESFMPVIKGMLTASAHSKGALLRWLSVFLYGNYDYSKEIYKVSRLSTRFLLHNVNNIIIQLSLPLFTSPKSTFPASIPFSYLTESAHSANRQILNFGYFETVGTHPQGGDINAGSGVYPFKVEIYYISLLSQYLALGSIVQHMQTWDQSIHHHTVDAAHKHYFFAVKLFHESCIDEPLLLGHISTHLNHLCKWLIHIAGATIQHSALPDTVPSIWHSVPKYYIDMVINFSLYLSQQDTEMDYYKVYDILSFLIIFLGNTEYISSSSQHTYLPLILYTWTHPHSKQKAMVEEHPWFSSNIIFNLISCYTVIPLHSYEKVRSRYIITGMLLKWLMNPIYLAYGKERVFQSKHGHSLFEFFIKECITEGSEALDSIIESLLHMKDMETQSIVTGTNATRSGPESTGHGPDSLEGTGEKLQFYLNVYESSFKVLKLCLERFNWKESNPAFDSSDHLMWKTISQVMIKILLKVAGRNSRELKVLNADKYNFNPRVLLESIVNSFVFFYQFSHSISHNQNAFLSEVCNSGVDINELIWVFQDNIIKRQLVSESNQHYLDVISSDILSIKDTVVGMNQLYDNAPDYVLCELMATPLINPVALPLGLFDFDSLKTSACSCSSVTPESLIIVDYNNIKHQLDYEKTNPYNRQPMTVQDLELFNQIPQVVAHIDSIKLKIKTWKLSVLK